MSNAAEKWRARFAKVVARAWTDDAFKAKLLSNPTAALAEVGIRIPPSVTVKVLENTQDTLHLVLPPVPFEGELDDYDLERLAATDTPTGFCCTHDCVIVAEELPD